MYYIGDFLAATHFESLHSVLRDSSRDAKGSGQSDKCTCPKGL